MALKERQDDSDLFFKTISPSLANRVQSNMFADKLVLNNSINRTMMFFKIKSIKELRKQAMLSPSEMEKLERNCIKRLFRKKMPVDVDEQYAYDKFLLYAIIDKMDTQFAGPEETVVK